MTTSPEHRLADYTRGGALSFRLYITFGIKYADEPHPTFPAAHPDGWLTVVNAADHEAARAAAVEALGTAWAFDYIEPPSRKYCPRGELGQLDARTGALTPALVAAATATT